MWPKVTQIEDEEEEQEEEEQEEQETEWGFLWRKSSRRCGLVVEEAAEEWAGGWKVRGECRSRRR